MHDVQLWLLDRYGRCGEEFRRTDGGAEIVRVVHD